MAVDHSDLSRAHDECINKSYGYGLATGSIVLTATYFVQKYFSGRYGGGNPTLIRWSIAVICLGITND